MPADCLFCKIANHELPSDMLYEDNDYVVFRDIHPKAPVHLLIVPRTHIRSVNDIEPEHTELVGGLFTLAAKMALKEGINKSGYKLLFNVEKGGDQEIFHLHLHLFGGWEK